LTYIVTHTCILSNDLDDILKEFPDSAVRLQGTIVQRIRTTQTHCSDQSLRWVTGLGFRTQLLFINVSFPFKSVPEKSL
jgi:hypothetical protein